MRRVVRYVLRVLASWRRGALRVLREAVLRRSVRV